jgi:hypothetical protein
MLGICHSPVVLAEQLVYARELENTPAGAFINSRDKKLATIFMEIDVL